MSANSPFSLAIRRDRSNLARLQQQQWDHTGDLSNPPGPKDQTDAPTRTPF